MSHVNELNEFYTLNPIQMKKMNLLITLFTHFVYAL